MAREFKYVPNEVKEDIFSGIFFPNYTHISSNTSREGINKTSKLMCISTAISEGAVPFSGEPDLNTYLTRAFYISLSRYPQNDEHSWSHYVDYGYIRWTPESSSQLVLFFKSELERLDGIEFHLGDVRDPGWRARRKIKIDECIRFEEVRQEVYETLSDKQKELIAEPRPDIYVFDYRLKPKITYHKFNEEATTPHPLVVSDINLKNYLIGMFTSLDIKETKDWISNVAEREVPVASIDALATCEKMVKTLPLFKGQVNMNSFYESIRADDQFKQRVIEEILRCD
ncbi:MAG TPA: hypothetical protein VI564_09120 [Candidatus Nanoarchaeia archaeon]|nr:hypothetical protein [Candidatus Nanoarchaeia archaeon]